MKPNGVKSILVTLVLLVTLSAINATAQVKELRAITFDDLISLGRIGSFEVSPDGRFLMLLRMLGEHCNKWAWTLIDNMPSRYRFEVIDLKTRRSVARPPRDHLIYDPKWVPFADHLVTLYPGRRHW